MLYVLLLHDPSGCFTIAITQLQDKALVDPENQETIKLIEKAEKDKLSAIETAREKGLVEGEHKKAIETAKNFLKMGLSIEQVASGTGLTVEELRVLK